MKLSNHSKRRMRERTPYNHNIRKSLFRNALDYGKSVNEIKNIELKEYLLQRQSTRNCKIKIYDNYVFIYSKNSKILYTMYKLPEKFTQESEVK